MSLRRVLVAIVIALVSGTCASSAAAQPYVVGSPIWNAAVSGGTAYWGAMPCGGEVSYGSASLPEGVIGSATWTRPSLSPSDPSTFSQCHIDFDPSIDLDPEHFCTALAHELGHLLGHDHVDDPTNLMAPQLGAPIAECVTAMAPFQPPAPAAAGQPKARRRAAAARKAKRDAARAARHHGRGARRHAVTAG